MALIEATWATSSWPLSLRLCSAMLLTAASTAMSMPRFSAIGLAPAVTWRRPCSKMASARTMAVVVPSPATSAVFDAAWLASFAPMFSNLSCSSISFDTVTPSFVTRGLP